MTRQWKYLILACGSRSWTDRVPMEQALYALGDEWGLDLGNDDDWDAVRVLHGNARGADRLFASEAQSFGCRVEAWPARWNEHGRRAGILRNLAMLDARPDVVIAFYDGHSAGTRHTMTEARRRGIRVIEVKP